MMTFDACPAKRDVWPGNNKMSCGESLCFSYATRTRAVAFNGIRAFKSAGTRREKLHVCELEGLSEGIG